MDIKSMMNDDKETKAGESPSERKPQAPPPPLVTSNSQPPTPSGYGAPPQHTSFYPPQHRHSQSQGLTPLQTPSQAHGGGQYPFPTSQQQSTSYQQYARPHDSHPISTQSPSVARPPSHGYPAYPHPQSAIPPGGHAPRSTSSHSPTPPSHHSPHSVRQSPLSGASNLPPSYPYQASHHHQQSQPSTPLGPPPLHHPRPPSSAFQDAHSPFHSRTFSGASNGVPSNSPAQHHQHLVESPSAYARPSPQALRRQSDYLPPTEPDTRERSLSVSPKTKVPPRPPSLGSRQSSMSQSQYEAYVGGRSSIQNLSGVSGGFPVAASAGHVTQSPSQVYSQQPPPQQQFGGVLHGGSQQQHQFAHAYPRARAGSEVSQHPPPPQQAGANSNAGSSFNNPHQAHQNFSSQPQQPLLQTNAPATPIHHQSQKMGMSHLLTPTTEVPPTLNGTNNASAPPPGPPAQRENAVEQSLTAARAERDPDVKVEGTNNLSSKEIQQRIPGFFSESALHSAMTSASSNKREVDRDTAPAAVNAGGANNLSSEEIQRQVPGFFSESALHGAMRGTSSNKRPAESDLEDGRPTKQRKMRKHPDRPIWACLSRKNPRFTQESSIEAWQARNPQGSNTQANNPQTNGQMNGHTAAVASYDVPPWQQKPPLDNDLINARNILGKWEKSFQWNTPMPGMLKGVIDWLVEELNVLRDVGNDPQEGMIEIEAKIGTLLTDQGDRLVLPVIGATIVRPHYIHSHGVRFESKMTMPEHKSMNDYLNASVASSHQKGRSRIAYKHLFERDSFHALSPLGLQSLPRALLNHKNTKRKPKLRITRDDDKKKPTHPVLAKIIKTSVADLHISNPDAPYDCRISINVEVNLDHYADGDVGELIADEKEGERMVDRAKDRLSYKHLLYSIDLTRVEMEGLEPSFELELEVDSAALREQMWRMMEGKPSAFADVVAGFLDNAVWLMRHKAA